MNKKKSIVILSLISVFIILMSVFSVIEFPCGVKDYTGFAKTISLGLDLSGGVSAEYKVKDSGDNLDQRIKGTVKSLQSLLLSKGFPEAVVSSSDKKIRVEVPDVEDPEKVFELVGKPQTLEFKSSADDSAETLIVGKTDIENAYVTTDPNNNSLYAVGLKFNKSGAKKFSEVTNNYKGKKLYIWIGGEILDEHKNGIQVNSAITDGNAVITGNYDYEGANALATQIQSGTFTVDLELIESRNISASLGQNAIKKTLIAGAIGVAIIFVFMILIYGFMGVAADIALAVYILILLWFSAVLPWVQFTLPGIAGVLLGIGMAVDANVVIFERIKDEYKFTNKPLKSAVKAGYKRGLAAVVDGNITTLIGAVILWIVGTSSIVGFAVVLFMSILISMFTALFVTRLVMSSFIAFRGSNDQKAARWYRLKKSEDVSKIRNTANEETKSKNRKQRKSRKNKMEVVKDEK